MRFIKKAVTYIPHQDEHPHLIIFKNIFDKMKINSIIKALFNLKTRHFKDCIEWIKRSDQSFVEMLLVNATMKRQAL